MILSLFYTLISDKNKSAIVLMVCSLKSQMQL